MSDMQQGPFTGTEANRMMKASREACAANEPMPLARRSAKGEAHCFACEMSVIATDDGWTHVRIDSAEAVRLLGKVSEAFLEVVALIEEFDAEHPDLWASCSEHPEGGCGYRDLPSFYTHALVMLCDAQDARAFVKTALTHAAHSERKEAVLPMRLRPDSSFMENQ